MFAIVLAAEAAHGAEKAAFPPFDPWHFPSQLFWLAVFFGFLYFALSRFILPKIGNTLERRESSIAGDLDEAARLNEEAVEAQKAVEVSIAKAHAKARETADKARTKIDKNMRTSASLGLIKLRTPPIIGREKERELLWTELRRAAMLP